MTKFKAYLHHLITRREESIFQKILFFPLCLLSFLYGLALSFRAYLYRKRVFKAHSLPCKVISVGNITLGGTGKTPFVSLLAERIHKRGYRAAILSRGYKGRYKGPYSLVSDGERVLMDFHQAGDEPYWLATKLRGIPVIVGKQRCLSGQHAIDRFRTEVVILDDGFQHLSLERDLNFLLIDSSCPLGNGRLFPRGILREPVDHISRADAIILTKTEGDDNILILKKNLAKLLEKIPVFETYYQPEQIWVAGQERSLPPETLTGKKVLAFSGIARPDSFKRTLLKLGANIAAFETFPDHYEYKPADLELLQEETVKSGSENMVTTEKDLVRLKDFTSGLISLWALSVRHVFREEDDLRFEAFLFERLGLKP